MNWPKLTKGNLIIIFLSSVFFLSLLFIGHSAYQRFLIILPIQKQLAELSPVKEAAIEFENGDLFITVGLDEVKNLQDSYNEVRNVLPKQGKYSLDIVDNRDEYLDDLWRKSRFAIEEAAILNNLVTGKEIIDKYFSEVEINKWLFEVDEDYLYFQLHNKNRYLYEIIPRNRIDSVNKSK
ncbi:MAG: hypothetical protein WDA53_08960 [Bacillota bacterium]